MEWLSGLTPQNWCHIIIVWWLLCSGYVYLRDKQQGVLVSLMDGVTLAFFISMLLTSLFMTLWLLSILARLAFTGEVW